MGKRWVFRGSFLAGKGIAEKGETQTRAPPGGGSEKPRGGTGRILKRGYRYRLRRGGQDCLGGTREGAEAEKGAPSLGGY